MSLLASTIWSKALEQFKKERPIPRGGTFTLVSCVETAINNFKGCPKEDNLINLINMVAESYGILLRENDGNKYDALITAAGHKLYPDIFLTIAEKYDPVDDGGSFLLYFHSIIQQELQ